MKAIVVIFAMGCRERTRKNIKIPWDRSSCILSVDTAQRHTKIKGLIQGKDIFILESGRIGLIIARRMKLEGADVKVVLEIMPYSSVLDGNSKSVNCCIRW